MQLLHGLWVCGGLGFVEWARCLRRVTNWGKGGLWWTFTCARN